MSPQGIVVVDVIGLGLILLMINLLRTNRLHVGYALIWISAIAVSMIVVSVPPILNGLPSVLGAVYPASALSLLAFVFIFLVLIFMSVRLTRLAKQQLELAQAFAIETCDSAEDEIDSDENDHGPLSAATKAP